MSEPNREGITKFKGYGIRFDENLGEFIFCDTGRPTKDTYLDRHCGACGKFSTSEGHDGLPNVVNACCGHGEPESAYIQFEQGVELRGQEALDSVAVYYETGQGVDVERFKQAMDKDKLISILLEANSQLREELSYTLYKLEKIESVLNESY